MKSTFFSSLMVFCALQVNSQTMQIAWDNTIGGDCGDCLTDLIALQDGGYLLMGHSSSNVSYDKTEPPIGPFPDPDLWLVRVDELGQVLWDRTIGGTDLDHGASVTPTPDGGFLLGSISRSGISGFKTEALRGVQDYWVVKVDANGVIQWEKTIGSSSGDQLRSSIETSDGGFLLVGHTEGGISGDKSVANKGGSDVWIVKLNSDRQIQWQRTLGGTLNDQLGWRPVLVDELGNIYIGASSNSNAGGDKTENSYGDFDFWLVKLDSDGETVWQKTLGGTGNEWMHDLQLDEEGSIYCIGTSTSGISGVKTEVSFGGSDYWLVKVSSTGDLLWDKSIGGSGEDELYYGAVRPSGNTVLAGFSNSGVSGLKTENGFGAWHYWALELGEEQSIIWQKSVTGDASDVLYGLALASDGGVLLGGCSTSGIGYDKTESYTPNPLCSVDDYWIVKLTPDEVVGTDEMTNEQFIISPNPFEKGITVKPSNLSDPFSIHVFDTFGRLVFEQRSVTGSLQIPTDAWSTGFYTIAVTSRLDRQVFKSIKK
jgi:hypothetical protein